MPPRETIVCDFKRNGILDNKLKIEWRKELVQTQIAFKT